MVYFVASIAFLLPDFSLALNVNQDGKAPKRAAVGELFEDDAEGLLKLLTNPGDGPGKGEAEPTIVFSGKSSLKITEYQRFHRTLPGWNHVIREKPEAGEYRYLRFAWKGDQANCLMLQLHDATDWHIRYTAGANPYGWMTRLVAEKAPATWTVVTVDLHKDFGDRTLSGIAFTIHGGAGYFDHVYLGRTIDDLDRIDANGLTKKEIRLEKHELDRHWQDLVAEDAAVQYRAFWTLVAGRERSEKYIKEKLSPPTATEPEAKQIREWIRDLNAVSFATRTKASQELKKRLDSALPILETELAGKSSTEMRRRIEALIAESPGREREQQRRQTALRVLNYIATPTSVGDNQQVKIRAEAAWPYAIGPGKEFVIRNGAELLAASTPKSKDQQPPEGAEQKALAEVAKAFKVKEIDWKTQMLVVIRLPKVHPMGIAMGRMEVREGKRIIHCDYWRPVAGRPQDPDPVPTDKTVMFLMDRFEGTITFAGNERTLK